MISNNDRRRVRRGEILKELGLTPVWRVRECTEDGNPSRTPESAQGMVAPVVAPSEFEEQVEQVCMPSANATEDVAEKRRAMILRMEWDQLKESVEGCVACRLCSSRTRTVFGVGDPNADWLYVGEGPGAQEDALGEPFVGQAGKLLDNMLMAIGLKRGRDVFIANIVKCRPPGNREPSDDEAQCCEPYLARQIELIKPRLIVALGKTAARNLLNTDASIGSLRGKLHQHEGIPVIVTYHPAYLLRTLVAKAKAWEDLCFAQRTMQALKAPE
ncbi:uracil-DNA glycosylase [Nitrosospira multiformis]|uniref:uracil-DNA glycosylase n=1 Tax=Nitrosospira multiformis TaxID=1231 RepID=UPI000896F78E|nr:uracil-DNA glycosylase [Nitrosospira multiformis]SEA52687.1 DNA polymerase [Nitrosospira multiformis]